MRIRILVVIFVVFLCQPALAQDPIPLLEFSGGYSLWRDFDLDSNSNGWLGSAGFNYNKWVGVYGEVGANFGSIDVPGGKVDLKIRSAMGGPQIVFRKLPRLTPFTHILLGVTDRGGSLFGGQTDLAMQFGGGTDLWLAPRVGLRTGGDFRHVFADFNPSNGFRLQVGIVVGVGSR